MDSKPFWQSKTLWANVIALALAILDGSYGVTGIPSEYLVWIVAALNVVLRFFTVVPVTAGKS